MVLIFQVRYHTEVGQALFLTGDHDVVGGGDPAKAVSLQYASEDFWRVTLEFPAGAAPDAEIRYHYILRNADGSTVEDWGLDRAVNPASFREREVLIVDAWNNAGNIENAFYTEPFQEVLLKWQPAAARVAAPARVTHVFRTKAPLLLPGQIACLLGPGNALGNWNTKQPVLMTRKAGESSFTTALDLTGESFPLAYKYGVWDAVKGEWVRFEDGADRMLNATVADGKRTIVNDGFARLPNTTWRGAGVAIPVFSLRSERSFGVGEFTDLTLLVDWARRTGLKLIQILPINDTTATHTWLDSYPYAGVSAFALHPIYLNLAKVAGKTHAGLLKRLEPERQRLNALEALDYEAVFKAKMEFLKEVFPAERERTFKSAGYRRFFKEHGDWLTPYAIFCRLRDKYGTADFTQWPEHRMCSSKTLATLAGAGSPVAAELGLHYFIQYHLHTQLREATKYAHAHGVILKGDLPIGISRHGADAWTEPEMYHMDLQAGAPPDAFAVKGQNWGFPTYNWPRMKQDGFAWWKRRFQQMAGYFDAFRIDHILGFFRIWSIPVDAVEGILGYFVPALPVNINEFPARGIAFDRRRYVQPWITDRILDDLFERDHHRVRREFLDSDGPGGDRLKPEFATQRQVERHFARLEDNPHNRKIKQGLFDLIANVILFEAAGSHGEHFHFRLGMEDTSSFKDLDADTQAKLKQLYVDYFYRRQDDFWAAKAMEKLPDLKRVTNMLVCGEDLGMVPACVPDVMRALGLLSLEIQRMPKDPGREFSNPKDAPYLSVVMPSTHDMSTIRGWWQEDERITRKFYDQELGESGEAPADCTPMINRAIVKQHLDSPAMWSIFQLQDLLGMDDGLRRKNPDDERINVPADPRHYWRYRMHLTLETLNAAQGFNAALAEDIRRSGRV